MWYGGTKCELKITFKVACHGHSKKCKWCVLITRIVIENCTIHKTYHIP